MMVEGREEGQECEVSADGMALKHVLEFKYLRFVLGKSGTDETECHTKVMVSECRGEIRV